MCLKLISLDDFIFGLWKRTNATLIALLSTILIERHIKARVSKIDEFGRFYLEVYWIYYMRKVQ